MASPQDSPTRKKQKARATKKLALWRAKHEAAVEAPESAREQAKPAAKK